MRPAATDTLSPVTIEAMRLPSEPLFTLASLYLASLDESVYIGLAFSSILMALMPMSSSA